jgi:alpha-1,6-mannosyltransferase
MRIVDVCAFYTPYGGGVKTYVERKLRAGAAAGHEVIILAPGVAEDSIVSSDGSRVVSLPSPRFPLDRRYGYFADEQALHTTLDKLAPDIVEASSPWGSAAMVARWQGNAPRVLVMHADPLASYAYRWLRPLASQRTIDQAFGWFWRHLRRLDERFDMVVSASDSLTERLMAGGVNKATTLPMGVEPDVFSPALRDEGLRARLLARCGLSPDAMLLLGVGRLSSEKRWPMVAEAVTAAAYHRPIGLVLLGDGRDRSRVVRAIGHNPHIQLLAPVTDRPKLAAIMASADALVHGCESETFCMVAAEAKASGLPLIVPDAGGASDHLRGWVGRRYAGGDKAKLALAIRAQAENVGRAVPLLAPKVMTMDEHFARLFDSYAPLQERQGHSKRFA